MTTDNTKLTAKYYVCEGSAEKGVTKVTPADAPEQALQLAQASTETVHFVSTINPLSEDGDNEA